MNNKFHERFEIYVDAEDTKAKFVARIRNRVFDTFCLNSGLQYWDLLPPVADRLGIEYDSRITSDAPIADYTGKDFHKTLQAVEALYETVSEKKKDELAQLIRTTLDDAELDLGIRWEDGTFLPSGAKLLDKDLIDESLHWLAESGHVSVTAPQALRWHHVARVENPLPPLTHQHKRRPVKRGAVFLG